MAKRKRTGANHRIESMSRQRSKKRAAGKLIRRCVVAAIVLAAAGGAALGAINGLKKASDLARNIEWLQVRTVRVRGARMVDTAAVLSAADITIGTPLTRLADKKIAARIETLAWVKKAAVRRQIPSTVTIAIKEREPIAMLSRGRVYLVDHEGVLFPMTPGVYIEAPIVFGLEDTVDSRGRARLNDHSIQRLSATVAQIQASDTRAAKGVTQIFFGNKGVVRLRFEAGSTLAIMSEDRMTSGFKQLGRVLDEARERGEMPRRVNLRYSNLAFVK